MNSMSENLAILGSRPVQKFLSRLNRQRHSALTLRYGFEVSLTPADLKIAKWLNSVYESVLWGGTDDADNKNIQEDERKIVDQYLRGSHWGESIVEIGCGSGRISRYLLRHAKKVTLCDRERLVLQKCKANLGRSGKNAAFWCHDLSKPPKPPKHYTAALLMENLLGMNPVAQDRSLILTHTSQLLSPGGIAIIAFRVRDDILSSFRFQAMPYTFSHGKEQHEMIGFAVNWSVSGMLKQLRDSGCNLRKWRHVRGKSRPAGGRMDYLIVRATSK